MSRGNKTEIVYFVVEEREDIETGETSYVLVKRSAWRGPKITLVAGNHRVANERFAQLFDLEPAAALARIRADADWRVREKERSLEYAKQTREKIYAATSVPTEARDLTDAAIAAKVERSKVR